MSLWKVVRPAAWAGFRTVSRLYLMLSGHQYRYIFILGHIRSGSSLLAHILASHPDIVGAGETHNSYQTPDDLPQVAHQTSKMLHRPILRENFVVDQINHPYVTEEVLLSEQVHKCVILIREPEATLKSMMNLLKCDEKEALRVYVIRLEALTKYGALLREKAFSIEYDNLVDHTEKTLGVLTAFLQLDSPLLPNYTTHRMTGTVEGFGDPSSNLKAGQIIRTASHAIVLGKDTMTAASDAFQMCRDQLQIATCGAAKNATLSGKSAAASAFSG
jgi:Sulfotransferase family